MTPRWDVAGFGAVSVDDLLYVDHHPLPDSKAMVGARSRQGGGLTGTALVAAARFGARAAYWGVLGHDELSAYTIREFEREGVDCSAIERRDEARPIHAIVIVDQSTGGRSILASLEGVFAPDPERIAALVPEVRVLFLDHFHPEVGLRAALTARQRGIPIVGDIEFVREPTVREVVDLIDHLIVSQALARELTGEAEPAAMVEALMTAQRTCAVVTAGEHGCWYATAPSAVHHVPALQVDVVDTTGCGDVFHGVYAACLAQGIPIDLAIRMATVAAGLKATRPGGRSGIPDRPTINRALHRLGETVAV